MKENMTTDLLLWKHTVKDSFQWNRALKMCQNFHASTLSSKGDFWLDFFALLRSTLRIIFFESRFALKNSRFRLSEDGGGGTFQTLSCLIRRVCSKTQTSANEWRIYEFQGAYWEIQKSVHGLFVGAGTFLLWVAVIRLQHGGQRSGRHLIHALQ